MVWRCPNCDEVVSVRQEARKEVVIKKRQRFERAEDGRCVHCHGDEATHRGPNKVCMLGHGSFASQGSALSVVGKESFVSRGDVVVQIGQPVTEDHTSSQERICGYVTWAISATLLVTGCTLLILMAAKTPELNSDGRILVGVISVLMILIGLTVLGMKLYPYFHTDLLCAECKAKKEQGRQSLLP